LDIEFLVDRVLDREGSQRGAAIEAIHLGQVTNQQRIVIASRLGVLVLRPVIGESIGRVRATNHGAVNRMPVIGRSGDLIAPGTVRGRVVHVLRIGSPEAGDITFIGGIGP